jgi:4-methyl-5(b-hydroxyethyl)-thiazole monophosphate biosynthesis
MKKALVPVANGFEEIEAVSIIDILRRGRIHVVVAGVGGRTLVGSRQIAIVAERGIEEVSGDEFDLICLPGGMPGTTGLAKSEVLGEMLVKQNDAGRLIGAICAAPTVLEKHGLLDGKKFTSHFSVKSKIEGGEYSEDRVVVDGNIVTSQGAGTALEFTLRLVEILEGEERAGKIAHAVIAAEAEAKTAS